MAGKKNRALYQLKVTLQEIQPPIWRRILVWEDATLTQLHRILQIVMGWEDYHLHQFEIGRRIYSVPDPDDDLYERKVIDESRVRLRRLSRESEPASSTCTTSAIAGGMNCCSKPLSCRIREHRIRAASLGNAARHPRMWAARLAMKTTWKRWPTPSTKSMRMGSGGGALSIPRRFRSRL